MLSDINIILTKYRAYQGKSKSEPPPYNPCTRAETSTRIKSDGVVLNVHHR